VKLVCTESDIEACNEIIKKLTGAGIDAETRPRAPSLFDPDGADKERELHEVWVVNDEDADKAAALLYPQED
jgi:hypothetical protein